jgi:cell division protein FtsL
MVDWANRIEARNYNVRRETDSRNIKELLKLILSLAMVAGVLVYYSWVRSHFISVGYESQNLKTAESTLLHAQQNLILEEETLKNPERIDTIARNELNLMPLHPNQLLPAQVQDIESSAAGVLAMADLPRSSGGLRKPSISN